MSLNCNTLSLALACRWMPASGPIRRFGLSSGMLDDTAILRIYYYDEET